MITQKQLLCTFSNNVQYTETLKEINKQYHLIDGKIFVFANEKNLRELYLTFNVVKLVSRPRCVAPSSPVA